MGNEGTASAVIPLPVASARLRLPWAAAYNALLSGKLEGELRGGRWFVTEESVLRLARERGSRIAVTPRPGSLP